MPRESAVNRRPRQTDIAQHAGVSVSTVSRVLANEPGISESVRQEIFRIAAELGYQTRAAPQAQLQQAIALVPIDQATGGLSVFYEGIFEGLRNAASRAGATLAVRLARTESLSVTELEGLLASAEADGVFLVGIDPLADVCRWLESSALPTVWVNGNDPDLRFDCVAPANFYGARLATRRLLAAGHRRIVHFTHVNRHTLRERARGFEAGIASVHGATGRIVRLDQPSNSVAARDAIEAALRDDKECSAAFCMNDMIAVGVLEAAAARGMSVPDDFAVVGFDDLPCASMTAPRLTTMRVDRQMLGREAFRLLQQQISEPEAEPRKVELAVRLVEGGTVGAASPIADIAE
jgi:DNA-binding LacI/PurR family transcriptional regulator